MKRRCWYAALAALLMTGSVGVFAAGDGASSLRVVSWNVQTFFDAVTDGTEYADFKGTKSRWSAQRYGTRLERLATALRALDADVVVLEELEKETQLYDIYNQLAGTFRLSALYAYGCFVAETGAAVGCGVLSRYPITDARVHALDISTENAVPPAMRPLLELRVQRGERTLALFVCHWKSKLGDGGAVWRRHQERVLADRMACAVADGIPALACGDFNMDVLEFTPLHFDDAASPASSATVVLRGTRPLAVYAPWLDSADVCADGSYWYRGAWERIDNFFACGAVILHDFRVERDGDWADADGRPVRYDVWTGAGYSDHLPISCTVEF